jgi:glycosyltransferase involved in cell wall biosynthesis
VLASRIARDGDRDGLPNVLAEAQSQGLPCVATRVSAIPELLRDGVSAHLVEEGDRAALAAALESLITQPARRRALGAAGEARVRAEFALEANLDRLAAKFGLDARDAGSAGEADAEVEDRAHRVLRSA